VSILEVEPSFASLQAKQAGERNGVRKSEAAQKGALGIDVENA